MSICRSTPTHDNALRSSIILKSPRAGTRRIPLRRSRRAFKHWNQTWTEHHLIYVVAGVVDIIYDYEGASMPPARRCWAPAAAVHNRLLEPECLRARASRARLFIVHARSRTSLTAPVLETLGCVLPVVV